MRWHLRTPELQTEIAGREVALKSNEGVFNFSAKGLVCFQLYQRWSRTVLHPGCMLLERWDVLKEEIWKYRLAGWLSVLLIGNRVVLLP